MGSEKKTDDIQRIDPEDYLDIEEQYFEKGGGGGKRGPSAGQKGKKTLKEIKKQGKRTTLDEKRKALEGKLQKIVGAIDDADEKSIHDYLNWANQILVGEFRLNPDEIDVSFSRSGGPGGQNVNRRATRVTLLHKPTRIRVTNDETRNQLRNRELAEAILTNRLQEHIRDWKSYLKPDTKKIDLPLLDELLERDH